MDNVPQLCSIRRQRLVRPCFQRPLSHNRILIFVMYLVLKSCSYALRRSAPMSNGSDASYTLAQYIRIARITLYQDLLKTSVELPVKHCICYTTTATFSTGCLALNRQMTFHS